MTTVSRRLLFLTLVFGSCIFAIREGLYYWHEATPPFDPLSYWPSAFMILIVLWVREDSKSYPTIYKPFDFGFLAFFFWIPYVPYYLIRTRGWRGIPIFLGILALCFLGVIAQLVLYAIMLRGE